jgi:outer membrane protein FlgP
MKWVVVFMSKIPTHDCLSPRCLHKTEKVFVLQIVKEADGAAESRGRPLKDTDMNRFMTSAAIASALLLSACSNFRAPGPMAAEVDNAGPASMITPMTEKSQNMVATGYAVISIQNHRNPAQQRLLAIRASKLDAYRALTEQVYGQQLDASTTVADMTVMNDTFRARVEGVVYGAVLVSITPVGDDTYETTLSLDRRVVSDLRALYIAHLRSKQN